MIFLMCTLPLTLIGMGGDAIASLLRRRQAPFLRHVVDVVQPIVLFGMLIPIGVTRIEPLEHQFAVCNNEAQCFVMAQELHRWRQIDLLLNFVMVLCNLVCFRSNTRLKEMIEKEMKNA